MAATLPTTDHTAATPVAATACLNAQVRIGMLGNGKALVRRYLR